MAITRYDVDIVRGEGVRGVDIIKGESVRGSFSASTYSADLSGAEAVVPKPGEGLELVITHLFVNLQADITVTIGGGKGSGSVSNVILGPLSYGAVDLRFDNPVALGDNVPLTADASAAGGVAIYAEGFIQEFN
jgi:hypothetical protein